MFRFLGFKKAEPSRPICEPKQNIPQTDFDNHYKYTIRKLKEESNDYMRQVYLLKNLLNDEKRKYRELVTLTQINLRCSHCGGDLGTVKASSIIDISLCPNCLQIQKDMSYTDGRYFLKEELLDLVEEEVVYVPS